MLILCMYDNKYILTWLDLTWCYLPSQHITKKIIYCGTSQVLLNQVGIQFLHSGIQPYNGNAQISINSIPRCNEHTDMIRY